MIVANFTLRDMESSNVGGTKRKLKENAFTAKAESGTLKVKILRRDQRHVDPLTSSTVSNLTPKTRTRRTAKLPPPESNSPPKPRPNRKHVPIFYEEQFRQPIKRGGSHSSSTDESTAHSTSSTAVQSSSSTEVSGAASTSSTTSSFVAQLSDVRLHSSTSGGDVEAPPRANPLFVRNDSDGLGTLGELLRPYFPSGSSALKPSFPLGEAKSTGTTSSARLLVDQAAGLSSALYQLASSSASYRSALDELSTATHTQQSTTDSTDKTTTVPTSTATAAATGMETYRFDPLAALQTAIDHARRVSANGNTDQHNDKREIGSPNSNVRYYRLEPSGSSGASHNENTSTSTSLGARPELPPAFILQNSLVGGGIQRLIPSKLSAEDERDIDASSSSRNDDSSTKDAIAALGPPPDAPPSFLLSNSLTGAGISMLNLPKSHPSFDRLGSLTRLISQANETAKDLNTTLSSPPKTHLSLDRLVSLTSMTSEDGETTKCTTSATPQQDTSSASSSTTHETESSSGGTMDLGPPPSGPPAFTIGNSLMGGGIELQPAAANVNTHNFNWKLHESSSSSGGDVTSSSATRGLSHGLRARLERRLTSSEHDIDKS